MVALLLNLVCLLLLLGGIALVLLNLLPAFVVLIVYYNSRVVFWLFAGVYLCWVVCWLDLDLVLFGCLTLVVVFVYLIC